MLQDLPPSKSTYRTESFDEGATPFFLSNDRSSGKNTAAPPRSKVGAILAKSRQKCARSRPRKQLEKYAVGCDRTASLVDVNEDDANPNADIDDADNDKIERESSSNNEKGITSYPSPPLTPNGSRPNAFGLVSILKGCAECGIATDYLYDDDGIAIDNDGSEIRRHTLCSRVSFSDELSVRELPQMSPEEKSRRFYTARELRSIRKDAREKREITSDQFNDDCTFFCEDLCHTFCARCVDAEACASRACVNGNAIDGRNVGGDNISEYGRYGGL